MEVKSTLISHLSHYEGKAVQLKGWVYNLRSSGQIGFLILRDGTGMCQCIITPEISQKSFETFKTLFQESCVTVEGYVKRWKEGFEVQVHNLDVVGTAQDYPISKKNHGIDFLLRHRHLWLRSKRTWAILKIRQEVTKSIHSFFSEQDFIQIESPILTPTPCEGSSSLFSVKFFEENMYLSQSGQLYLEAAAAAFGKVYCFNPVFRAEKSNTRRHLLEFWMVEPEIAFCHLDQCMQVAENITVFVIQRVLKHCQKELEILDKDTSLLEKIQSPFPRIHYKEAVEILADKRSDSFSFGEDFGGEDETLLGSLFNKPVFVHHYPVEIKAFYMKTDIKEPQFSLSFDLLAPQGYGEIVGGGEREDSLQTLKHKMERHQVDIKNLKWYLDIRRYGTFPHSGFGLGVDRFVSWICGLTHVREATAFPRLYGRSWFENS